jgi:heme-degrading monooxygenase HmoA
MIMRMWHGVTEEALSDAYCQYIMETGVPMYRAQKGNQGVYLLRRTQDGKAEFYLLSLWVSYEVIQQFAGPDINKATYFAKDKDYLIEMEPNVSHFEILMEP